MNSLDFKQEDVHQPMLTLEEGPAHQTPIEALDVDTV